MFKSFSIVIPVLLVICCQAQDLDSNRKLLDLDDRFAIAKLEYEHSRKNTAASSKQKISDYITSNGVIPMEHH